jgi:hypothetical protein
VISVFVCAGYYVYGGKGEEGELTRDGFARFSVTLVRYIWVMMVGWWKRRNGSGGGVEEE